MAYVDLVLCQAMYLNSENMHSLKQILLLVSVDWMPVINSSTRWWSCIVRIRVLEMWQNPLITSQTLLTTQSGCMCYANIYYCIRYRSPLSHLWQVDMWVFEAIAKVIAYCYILFIKFKLKSLKMLVGIVCFITQMSNSSDWMM